MLRKVNKTEKKVIMGLIKKVLKFIATLNPEEIDILVGLLGGSISNLSIETED